MLKVTGTERAQNPGEKTAHTWTGGTATPLKARLTIKNIRKQHTVTYTQPKDKHSWMDKDGGGQRADEPREGRRQTVN
ncbi:hypothetical protein ACQP3C_30255, partial [Escherichia coli]